MPDPMLTPEQRRRLCEQALAALLTAHDALAARLQQVEEERDEARAIVADVNNSVLGSQGYFTKPSCVDAIEELKASSNRLRYDLRQRIAQLEADIRDWNVCENHRPDRWMPPAGVCAICEAIEAEQRSAQLEADAIPREDRERALGLARMAVMAEARRLLRLEES